MEVHSSSDGQSRDAKTHMLLVVLLIYHLADWCNVMSTVGVSRLDLGD